MTKKKETETKNGIETEIEIEKGEVVPDLERGGDAGEF